MSNTTYRLDAAEEQMFRLYRHAVHIISDEMSNRTNFRIGLDNDVSNFAICNAAINQYFEHGQVPSPYLVHSVCLAMIQLLHIYAPQYSAELNKIIALKEGAKYTAKASKAKRPVDADPSVGIIAVAPETFTKS